jgi:5'-nucleotidase
VEPLGCTPEMQRLAEHDHRGDILEIQLHNRRLSEGVRSFIGLHHVACATIVHEEGLLMSLVTWSAVIGTVAACCSTLAFLPQLLKVRRQGGADVSAAMLAIYLIGLGLWLAYGLINRAGAIIGANLASIGLVSAVAILKGRGGRRTADATRRLRIAIDMDEVMADALAEHVRRYNAVFDPPIAIEDLRGRHLEDFIPVEHRDAAEALLDDTFFADLALMPDCQEVIRELASHHDVFVVTAAMDVPCSFAAKYQWLQRHFPFIPRSNIVFCGDKGIVDADYLIDDRARHFERFQGKPLLFSAPHNAAERRYPRVSTWAEVRDVFAHLRSSADGRTAGSQRRAILTGAAARS